VPVFYGLENFRVIFFDDPIFWKSLGITLVFTAGAVATEFSLGLFLALLLNEEFRGKNVYVAILIVPLVMTPVTSGLIWRLAFDPDFGSVNYLLSLINITGPNWLNTAGTALIGVIIVDVWQWTPFITLSLMAGLSALPSEVYESAEVDGASKWQVFRNVTVPLLMPIIVVVSFFRILDSFKIFDIIFVMTRGGPGDSTTTLNMYIYKTLFQFHHVGYSSALTFLFLMAVTYLFLFLSNRLKAQLWK